MFKNLSTGPSGATAAKVGVSTSKPFEQIASAQAAKLAADLAERRAAGDTSQYQYKNPQDVMAAAFKQSPGGPPVPTMKQSQPPNLMDEPDFFAAAGSRNYQDWPAVSSSLPDGLAGLKVPLGFSQTKPKLTVADFAAKAKAGLLNELPTGGNSHRRSALKAKRSRKSKSKSAKRCRRNRVKAMRSRRAHRRYMMTV